MRLSGAVLLLTLLLQNVLNGHPAAAPCGRPAPLKGMNANPMYQWWRDPSGPEPDSWWGRSQTAATLQAQINLLLKLGVRSYRFEVPWSFVAPTQPGGASYNSVMAQDQSWPGYQWQRLDLIVRLLVQASIQPLPLVVYTPAWASGVPITIKGGPNNPPASPVYYEDFMAALVNRYHGSINTWELWNEPDHWHTWVGSPDQYVHLILQPGYKAVKAIDPKATVVFGGPAGVGSLGAFYRAGAKGYFDVMSIHNYPVGSGSAMVEDAVNRAKKYMAKMGDGAKPVWLTEVGIMTAQTVSPGSATAGSASQAQLVTNVFTNVRTERVYWYQLADTNVYGSGDTLVKHTFWGLVSRDLTILKPSFAAFQSVPQCAAATK